MATRIKPLMSAAALATTAAVAVATPAIAPSITSATSPALSSANVELANFAALLSIPASEWNNVLYEGWGSAIGTIPPIDPDPTTYADYWLPYCDYDCSIGGISGVAYLALDALINGTNGYYTPTEYDQEGNPIDGYAAWGLSAVNYFYEGSFSTGLQYILESPFLGYPYKEAGPLYNPAIADAIALAFQGPYIVTTLYTTALTLAAVAANNIPLIGEYLYRGIGSYLGPQFSSIDAEYDYGNGAYVGLSGVLRYIGGVITTGGNPNPYPTLLVTPAASTAASTVAPAAKIPASVSASLAGAPAAAPVADIKVAAASTESTSTPAVSASPTATTVGSTASETTPATTAADAVANTPVANTPAATAAATKPATAAAPSRKRPVRSAAASAAKAVTSAVSGAVSGAAAGAGSATGGASAAN